MKIKLKIPTQNFMKKISYSTEDRKLIITTNIHASQGGIFL